MKLSFALYSLGAVCATAAAEHDSANFVTDYHQQNRDELFANPVVAEWRSCGEKCREYDIEMGVIDVPEINDHHLRTRTYGQHGRMSLPGPTIRTAPGELLRINFRNMLVEQATANTVEGELVNGTWHGVENRYRNPDHTNLHTHGFYVSPGSVSKHRGSDDILVEIPGAEEMQEKLTSEGGGVVGPGGSHVYEYQVPADHMPGTLWIHGHYHGSTSLQVGGGAAMALIVEDPEDYGLPAAVKEAEDSVLLVSLMSNGCFRNNLTEVAESSGDEVFLLDPLHPADNYWQKCAGIPGEMCFADNPPPQSPETGSEKCFHMLNGKHQPTKPMVAGEWQRWRVINAGISQDVLQMRVSAGCEMQLLAKDSIYISDFPRKIREAVVPAGGRADVMVRCSTAGDHTVTVNGDFPDLLGAADPSHCLNAPMNRAMVAAGNLTAEMCPANHWREVLLKMKVTDGEGASTDASSSGSVDLIDVEMAKAAEAARSGPSFVAELPKWSPTRPGYQLDHMGASNANANTGRRSLRAAQQQQQQQEDDTCSCPYQFKIEFEDPSTPGPHPAIGRKIFPGVDFAINSHIWSGHKYAHVSSLDQTQERVVESSFHPYHQHIYPFQLTTEQYDVDNDAKAAGYEPYFKPGDWHDVYMHQWKFGYYINAAGGILGIGPDTADAYGPYASDGERDMSKVAPGGAEWKMKYTPTKFYGNIVMHCHILEHEDTGMMTMEYLFPQRNNTCMCNYQDRLAATSDAAGGYPANSGGWLTGSYKGVLGPAISPNLLSSADQSSAGAGTTAGGVYGTAATAGSGMAPNALGAAVQSRQRQRQRQLRGLK